MYLNYNLDELADDVNEFIIANDRMLFAPIFKTIEEYCIKHNLIIGGDVGLDLQMDKPLNRDSFSWQLYSTRSFEDAKNIANEIFKTKSPHVDVTTTALDTKIKYKEFEIYVEARLILKIFQLDKYDGVSIMQVLKPATRVGYFTKKPIACMDSTLQLVNIYRKIYSPKYTSNIASLLETEASIFDKAMLKTGSGTIGDSTAASNDEIIGGSASIISIDASNTDANISAYDAFVMSLNCVVVGDYAMYKHGLLKNPKKLSVIVDWPVDEYEKRLTQNAPSVMRGTVVKKYKKFINLSNDFQLMKYTVKVGDKSIDVYNSTTFELIPFIDLDGIACGTYWVLLRFLAVELWSTKLKLHSKPHLKAQFDQIHKNINTVRELALGMIASIDNTNGDANGADDTAVTKITKILFPINYAGVYLDENVTKKKLIKEQSPEFLKTFYPALANHASRE